MRTKALLGLAALAVGLSTSMAQNVYSLNVVGYYNVTAKANAYTLLANSLNNGTNGINQVLPSAPDGALVLKFNNNVYNSDLSLGGAWYDANTQAPSTTTLKPGEGFFYNNPNSTDLTVTFVGEVPQGSDLTVVIPPNYGLLGTYTPEMLELTAANNFPAVDGELYLSFSNNVYTTALNLGGAWFDANTQAPVTVAPAVGQGYFINNPDTVNHNWVRNFTVQ